MKKYLSGNILVVVLIVIIIWTVLIVGNHDNNGNNDIFQNLETMEISTGWSYDFGNGVSGITNLPATLPKTTSKELTLRRSLPTITTPTSFFYKERHIPTRITVGGEVRIDRISGRDYSSYWKDMDGIFYIEVPIYPEDSGKEIEIYGYGNSKKYINSPGKVILGDRGSVFLSLINNRWKTLLFIGLLGALSVVLIILWLFVLVIAKVNSKEILCLGIYSALITLWLVTESEVFQFMSADTGKMTVLAYELLMFMAMPMALFFYYYSEQESTKHFAKILSFIPIILLLVENILMEINRVHLTDSLFYSQILLGVETICIAILQIREVCYKYKMKENYNPVAWKIPLFGICCLAPLAAIEIVKYAFYSTRAAGDGIMISLGVLIYMMTLAVDCLVKIEFRAQNRVMQADTQSRHLSNMSDEIAIPAKAISVFNSLTIKNTKDPAIREIALDMADAVNRLNTAIHAVFDENNDEFELDYVYKEYYLAKAIYGSNNMFMSMAKRKNLEYKVEVDPEIPSVLIGDDDHITQVLMILVDNAIQYTSKGEISIHYQLVSKDDTKCKIRISVVDGGEGISDEEKEKILDRINQKATRNKVKEAYTNDRDLILNKLVNMLDAKIDISSEMGKGTTISFEVEQIIADPQPINDYQEMVNQIEQFAVTQFDFKAPDLKVLLVDDDRMLLDVFRVYLQSAGMQVEIAISANAAIEAINREHKDIIIMDQTLPKVDGLEAASYIRKLALNKKDMYYATVPIILIASNNGINMNDKLALSGINDVLKKPIELEALNAMFRKWAEPEKIEDVELTKSEINYCIIDKRWNELPECINAEKVKSSYPMFDTFFTACKTYLRKGGVGLLKLKAFCEREDYINLVIGLGILKQASISVGMTLLENMIDETLMIEDKESSDIFLKKTREVIEYAEKGMDSIEQYVKKIE